MILSRIKEMTATMTRPAKATYGKSFELHISKRREYESGDCCEPARLLLRGSYMYSFARDRGPT